MTSPNSLTFPVVGDTSDLWGDVLNTLLVLLDNADHTTGKGLPIPSAALNINADVSWNLHALTAARAVTFTAVNPSTVTGLNNALFVSSSDNNFYFRNSSGSNVQLTSGATINFAIAGGIGGDYAAVSALVDFDDASDTYRFRQQVGAAVRQFAKMSSADVNLFEYKANPAAGVPSFAVTLKSPAALAAPYSVTWLGALPGSTQLIQISTAGVLTATNTLANALTVPGLSHTDVWEYPVPLQPVAALVTNTGYNADHISIDSTGINWTFYTQVLQGLRAGDRIKSIISTLSGGGTFSYDIYKISGGAASALGIGGALLTGTRTTNLAAPYTLLAGDSHFVVIQGTANAANASQIKLALDHP